MDVLNDALRLSDVWRTQLDLRALLEEQLREHDALIAEVDVVAIGKASREMVTVTKKILGGRVRRTFIVSSVYGDESQSPSTTVVVGEHPIPGARSLEAGRRLVEFLERASDASCTLFLVSGGASSLCALPAPPLVLDDLATIWAAALENGVNITALNQLRAATSQIAGGAVLRHVRTLHSLALLMVDNVVSGAPWVASGLTYEFRPSLDEVQRLIEVFGLQSSDVAARINAAFRSRAETMRAPFNVVHENAIVAEPVMVLWHTVHEARRLGYRVVDLGAAIRADVAEVAELVCESLRDAFSTGERVCVVGVGEVTVRVRGDGVGGRCQELAWLMAKRLSTLGHEAGFVARATDGQDFVPGVGGAWVDSSTIARCVALGIDWEEIAVSNDAFHGLRALGQLLEGEHTGWNLCDLYVAIA